MKRADASLAYTTPSVTSKILDNFALCRDKLPEQLRSDNYSTRLKEGIASIASLIYFFFKISSVKILQCTDKTQQMLKTQRCFLMVQDRDTSTVGDGTSRRRVDLKKKYHKIL